jgi:hypothetical protein
MKKIIILILTLLIAALPVYASGAGSVLLNTSILLRADSINQTAYDGGVSSVNITITNPNKEIVVNNQEMTLNGTGRWYYNYTPLSVGAYYIANTYYNSTGHSVALLTDSFDVYNTPEVTTNMIQAIFSQFLLFAVGILLIWLGYYIANAIMILSGGVWFIGNSVVLAFENQGFSAPMFFALIGFVTVYYAIEKLILEKQRKKAKRDMAFDGEDEETE